MGWVSWGKCACRRPVTTLLRHVLRDEALTRGLGDIEARMLVEWVTDWTELLAEASRNEDDAWSCVASPVPPRPGHRPIRAALGRARPVAARLRNSRRPSASAGRYPRPGVDAGDLMHHILTWENQHPEG